MFERLKLTKIFFFIFVVLLVMGAGFFWFVRSGERPAENSPATFEPYRATVTGSYLCLPHTDTSGPQTLECALGLQTDDGIYYALDFNRWSALPADVPTGSRVTATGTVTPIENLSSDHWRTYPIKGIFSVTDSFEAI